MMARAPRDLREILREEPLMHRPILAALADGPRTVPEIAGAIGRPTAEVVYWIMGMRRYGLVVESAQPTDEGFFAYRAAKGGVGSP